MIDATHKSNVPRFSMPIGAIYEHVLAAFLAKVYALGASDIKFSSTDYVWAEIARTWHPVTDRKLDHEEVVTVLTTLFNASGQSELGAGKSIDSRAVAVISRDNRLEFRLNATGCFVGTTTAGLNITLRSMPKEIPSCEKLGIEQEIMDALFPRYGLVLLVGTTGSGKSTFLAAAHRHRLVNRRHDPVHILTYEDPVEYRLAGLAEGSMPEPTQTEVGAGGQLKEMALVGPNAMRRKGQVVQMGEIRDSDSARAGFTLGATGHATYATMHTETPARALSRTLQFFPPVEHTKVANDFMEQARLVVAQKLASKRDGGVIAFRSWLVFDREVTRRIEEVPVNQWVRTMRDMTAARGTDFESKSLSALKDGLISFETFLEVSTLTREEGVATILKAGLRLDAEGLDIAGARKVFTASAAGPEASAIPAAPLEAASAAPVLAAVCSPASPAAAPLVRAAAPVEENASNSRPHCVQATNAAQRPAPAASQPPAASSPFTQAPTGAPAPSAGTARLGAAPARPQPLNGVQPAAPHGAGRPLGPGPSIELDPAAREFEFEQRSSAPAPSGPTMSRFGPNGPHISQPARTAAGRLPPAREIHASRGAPVVRPAPGVDRPPRQSVPAQGESLFHRLSRGAMDMAQIRSAGKPREIHVAAQAPAPSAPAPMRRF